MYCDTDVVLVGIAMADPLSVLDGIDVSVVDAGLSETISNVEDDDAVVLVSKPEEDGVGVG